MSFNILWKASKLAASLLILNWSFFTIIEHGVASLALKYPCKKYKIVDENVHCFLCSCMRNKYLHARVTVRSVHIQVMFKVISFSIFNMHELVETCMVARVISFWNSQTDMYSQTYTFPEQMNNLTICPDINGFQIPVKTSCTGNRWRKTKTLSFSVQGKSSWYCFYGFCCFVVCKLPPQPSSPPIPYMNLLWT